MPNSITWVGMDVHKESIVVTALSDDSDRVTARFEIPNTETGVYRLGRPGTNRRTLGLTMR